METPIQVRQHQFRDIEDLRMGVYGAALHATQLSSVNPSGKVMADSSTGTTQVTAVPFIGQYRQFCHHEERLPSNGPVKVTFFWLPNLRFDDGETQLLVDGWFSRYPLEQSQTTPTATDTALVARYIRDFRMNRIRGIFVTHTHWDHAFYVAEVANRTGATMYGSVSTHKVVRAGNVPEKKLKLFSQDARYHLGRFTVTVLPSKHSPIALVDKEHGRIIDKPMSQPALATDYPEGGSYDFLISHNGQKLFVKPSANWIDGAFDRFRSDVLFLGIATLGQQKQVWRDSFYTQTVGQLKTSLVIPLHWDDFYSSLQKTCRCGLPGPITVRRASTTWPGVLGKIRLNSKYCKGNAPSCFLRKNNADDKKKN
jgi:L-ascorbate metabolism protein UlaG (beta-lactamase superfamily)